MRTEESALLAVATSIADGAGINWSDVESSARDDRQRSLIRQLRVLSGLAQLHRTYLPAPAPARLSLPAPAAAVLPPTPRAAEAAVGDDTALGRWGHLQLVEKIGAGTFGEVFRAWDPRLEREVALKLLKPAGGPLDSLAERVLHEGRLLARVRHPNVLTVFEAEAREGRVGICMEFIKGQTLDQVLGKQGPFGAREALLVGLDLCRALAAVHNSGLVHRDVKAQNVMREEGGRIVLMDFSSGQELREPGGTVLPSMAGTPLYLAPEILSGRDATVRSDIYSVGVLLYHLVTASFPIRTKTMEELWKAHKQGQFKRLRDARPDLPERFVQAVERAIAGNPDERYESAGDMEAALMSALEVSPLAISATPRPLTAVPAAESAAAAVTPAEAWIGRRAVAVASGLLAVLLAAIYWSVGSRENTATPALVTAGQIERIAVLPFENVTGSQEASDLAAAVPLELTARLGQIGALKVVPWSYMRTLDPGATRTISDVGRATNADAIVDGSVQVVPGTSNNRTVRVAVQVFHAGTGVLLWSGAFDRPLADFLKLQGDLAQAIASELKVKLARREEMLLARAPQVDPEAMELYLKGRQAWDERDADGLRRGLEYFRLAVERDPNFAAAHVGIADSYALLSAYYHTVSGKEAYTRAMDATSRALAIDNMLAEAWTSRAFVRYVFGWEWEAAQADFSRALELDPASVLTHHWYADYLTTLGRHDEAIRESQLAEERAPFSAPVSRRVAWSYYFARRYDDAIAQLKKTLALEPDFLPAHTLLGRAYVQRGFYDLAITELTGAGPAYLDLLAHAYAAAGRRADAERTLADATAGGCPPYGIAVAYAALGEKDLAFAWLERAYNARDEGVANLKVDPLLDSLRDDPRFAALLARLKFPS